MIQLLSENFIPCSLVQISSNCQFCHNSNRYRERITWQPAIYTFASLFTWAGAMYFFLNKSTSWVKTPAQSRHLNMDCR